MLFLQEITIRYEKDVRYASYANQRRALRFWKLPENCPPENAVFFQKVFLWQTTDSLHCCEQKLCTFDSRFFYDGSFRATPQGIAETAQEGDSYRILYGGLHNKGFYQTAFVLHPGEYGRLVYNRRSIHCYTGIWYYDLIQLNFVNAPYTAYRPKLFFRKEPDHEFRAMHALRYSG